MDRDDGRSFRVSREARDAAGYGGRSHSHIKSLDTESSPEIKIKGKKTPPQTEAGCLSSSLSQTSVSSSASSLPERRSRENLSPSQVQPTYRQSRRKVSSTITSAEQVNYNMSGGSAWPGQVSLQTMQTWPELQTNITWPSFPSPAPGAHVSSQNITSNMSTGQFQSVSPSSSSRVESHGQCPPGALVAPKAGPAATQRLRNMVIRRRGTDTNVDDFRDQLPPAHHPQTAEEEGKKNRRKYQNKMAARRCRDRRKNISDTLFKQYQFLECANTNLNYQIRELEKEKAKLHGVLESHLQEECVNTANS